MEQNKLGTQKVAPLLWELSLPAIAGMLSSAIYNIVDRIFIGRLDPLAMTGVGVTMPIQVLQMAFVLLLGVGASMTISIKLGEGNTEAAEGVLHTTFKYSLISLTLFSIFALLFLDKLFAVLSISAEAAPYAKAYIGVLLIGSIISMPGYCINPSLRAVGLAKVSMRIIVVSSILNIILDPIFIFVFDMGIAGAALATALAQTYTTVRIITIFIKGKNMPIRLRAKRPGKDWDYLPDILKNGSPSFSIQIFATIINTFINKAVMAIGADAAIATVTIMSSIVTFYQMIINGISQGNQPICGFNYGAKQFDRVRQSLWLSLLWTGAVSLVFSIAIFCFPTQLISIFTDDADLIATGSAAIPLYLMMLPAAGFHIIISQYFQAVECPRTATFLLFLRYGTILLPSIYLLCYLFQLGINGIYLSNALSDGLSCAIALGFVAVELRRLKQTPTSAP
ncbi:MAG: MATE family efflux transporter [Faecalibacterium sp.]